MIQIIGSSIPRVVIAGVVFVAFVGVAQPLQAQSGASIRVSATVVSTEATLEGRDQAHVAAARLLQDSGEGGHTLTESGLARVRAEWVSWDADAPARTSEPLDRPAPTTDRVRVTVAFVAN